MTDTSPILIWLRRDFRLQDNPMLHAACATGRAVIPVFILDEVVETFGAAPKWRLEQSIACFAKQLEALGARLILRRGSAQTVLLELAEEVGATDVWWTRAYDPDAVVRDTAVKAALTEADYGAKSIPGAVMFEPWDVATQQGGFYKVYSAYWRCVKDRHVDAPLPAPTSWTVPAVWPASDDLADLELARAMNRGAAVLARYAQIGEEAAQARLDRFLDQAVATYKEDRDFPSLPATSGLSEHLAWGEISPRVIWHAGQRALAEGAAGAEHFLKELVWREFAYHLVLHTPHIVKDNWRPEWDRFAWSVEDDADVLRWKQGRTGVPFVDAAMRELYVTGIMHNRARMIVGSYLTKNMLKHWRIGQRWFEECLIDWDPAANAMGWQWVAGCGPDASPYFRVFNPETQAKKFDRDGAYIAEYLAEAGLVKSEAALAFFEACPRSWGLSPTALYPEPMLSLAEGRQRALAAYSQR